MRRSKLADFDADGRADLAVYRPSTATWFVRQSSTDYVTSVSVNHEFDGDAPVSRDYDGDGRTDVAVYRPVGRHLVLSLSGAASSTQWGVDGDVLVPDDYDGDGIVDLQCTGHRPEHGTFFSEYAVWYVCQPPMGGWTATSRFLATTMVMGLWTLLCTVR